MGSDFKKYAKAGAAIFALFILLVGGRVFYLQRGHFQDAERYLAEGNRKLAMREYDTSLHFYVPLSPYTERAALRLWEMGEAFEAEGSPDWAHMAYSSIRSSFYSSRSLYTPRKDWIDRCDEKLADLNVRMLIADGSIKPEEAEEERAKHMKVFKTDLAPSVFWSVMAELGFFGWVGAAIFTAFRGFGKDGSLKRRPALYGVLMFVAFIALWAVALLRV